MLDWLKKNKLKQHFTAGWVIEPRSGGFVWFNPEAITRDSVKSPSPKAVTKCPAVLDLEARYYLIRCPFDINIALDVRGDKVSVKCLDPMKSTLNPRALNELISVSGRDQWRHPERPIVQIATPYRFVSDDMIYISQLPPFLYYTDLPWPGTIFSGRFPMHVWPRILMWAFEWYDVKKPLVIRRGDPWFMVYLETSNPDKKVRLVEAERTDALVQYFNMIDGVTPYVNQTFSLFKLAERRRPKKLLVPKTY